MYYGVESCFLFVAMVLFECACSSARIVHWETTATIPWSYFDVAVPNIVRCAQLCDDQGKCVAVSYDVGAGVCYLHAAASTTVGRERNGRYMYMILPLVAGSLPKRCDSNEVIIPSLMGTSDCKAITFKERGNGMRDYSFESSVRLCFRVVPHPKTADANFDKSVVCDSDERLLIVDNDDKQEFIETVMMEKGVGYLRIGMKYSKEVQNWIWVDGSKVVWSHWREFEPNENGPCVFLVRDLEYFWDDLSCVNAWVGAVTLHTGCEKPEYP